MRIAQVAPLWESVPPRKYGGTERVVYNLTEALVEAGHDVTLFASGDSRTSADLVPVVRESLRLSKRPRDAAICELLQLAELERQGHKFDIIHFHTDHAHLLAARHLETPSVTTMHGRLDFPDLRLLFREFREAPLVSISDSQRKPLPEANWVGTVYNGTAVECYSFKSEGGDYLAFLGRISPDKGPEEAIEIAVRVGLPLKIAAKIDPTDREYYAQKIEPLLDHPLVEFVGEVDERGKNELLCNARALLFPIQWPEPFGLVMTESMACGTPVVAYRNGSVDEVMRDGVSGYIVDSIDEAVAAVERIDQIDRVGCRRYFDEQFSVAQMACGYLNIYQQLVEGAVAEPERCLGGGGVDLSTGIKTDAGLSKNGMKATIAPYTT